MITLVVGAFDLDIRNLCARFRTASELFRPAPGTSVERCPGNYGRPFRLSSTVREEANSGPHLEDAVGVFVGRHPPPSSPT